MTEYCPKYSHKNFAHIDLTTATDLDNKTIRSTSFASEQPDTIKFPPDVQNLTLVNCNLQNIVIPEGVTLVDCDNTRYECQNDGNDWEIDEEGRPLCVMSYLYFYKKGFIHPDPNDIPEERVETPIDYFDPDRNVRV